MSVVPEAVEDRLVLQPEDPERVTVSGIIIPETAQKKAVKGVVLSVGPGRVTVEGERIPVDFEVGQVVVYTQYAGNEVIIDGVPYILVSSRDVLCRLIERGGHDVVAQPAVVARVEVSI